MKIKNLLIGMLACTAWVGCTNDKDVIDNPNENLASNGQKYYMAVSFSMPGNSSSRAAALGGFTDGDANEIAVNNAKFFFFNAAGNSVADACYVPVAVNGNDINNFAWTTPTPVGTSTDNIQAEAGSVIVLKDPTEIPSRIVAVLNAGDLKVNNGDRPTLAQLQAVVATYTDNTYTGMPTGGGMVMSSTAYLDANNQLMMGAPVSAENIITQGDYEVGDPYTGTNPAPVVIPVEKVLAKVTVSQSENFAITEGSTTLGSLTDAGTGEGAATTTTNNVTLTVDIDGWWLDSTPTQSYLLKNIDGVNYTWDWNAAGNFRSYWANSYAGTNPAQAYANDQYGKQAELGASLYTQENTVTPLNVISDNAVDNSVNVYSENNRTKVVVAATLKNAQDDVAVDLVKWYGNYYTKDGFLTAFANLQDVKKYYTRTGGEGTAASPYVYTSLTSDKLKLVSNSDVTVAEGTTPPAEIDFDNQMNIIVNGAAIRNYEAAVELNLATTDNVPEKLYTFVNGTATEVTDLDAVNTALRNISKVMYWNGGKTYYYVELEQNTVGTGEDATTYYGVVRNHLYDVTINGIKGLGTPVPNPDKIIIPERPDDDNENTYISAKIQILAYRVVSQGVILE